MYEHPPERAVRYRVWIAIPRWERGHAGAANSPSTVVLEPAEAGSMPPRQATRYVETFNRVAAAHGRSVRAIALPVTVRYEGDPAPGEAIDVPFLGLSDHR